MDKLEDGRIDSSTQINLSYAGFWVKKKKILWGFLYEIFDMKELEDLDRKEFDILIYSEHKRDNKKIFIFKK